MKEGYFYKKDVLIKLIQTPKQYPYVQIYSALTQLIEDNNEFIVDKFGRYGRLVNIGEYYLFQPIELHDKNISIYDRSNPIEYKNKYINFKLNPEVERNEQPISDTNTSNKILEEFKINFNITKEHIKVNKIPRGEDNWYKHCGIAIKKLSSEYPDMKEYLLEFVVSHMIEMLLFKDKLEYMNYIYSLENINKEQDIIEYYSKKYFESKIIITKHFSAFILYDLNKLKIMLLNENNVWVDAEAEDIKDLESSPEGKKALSFNIKEYNKIVGFMGFDKKNRFLIFKTKDLNSSRDTGARCDESGKEKTLNKINTIIGEIKYTSENTKAQKDSDGNIIHEAIGQIELCVIQEFIMRYYNKNKKNNLKWWFTPEMALYHKLYKVIV
jgi:hypothetical protein